MKGLLWLADAASWPAIQMSISLWILGRSTKNFEHDGSITRARSWEQQGRVYRSIFYVNRWKNYLPDGAEWFGKQSKKKLTGTGKANLTQLQTETRRAELAHWLMLACTPILFLWNPPWACAVLLGAGLVTNLPCILVQRYNRARLNRILARAAG